MDSVKALRGRVAIVTGAAQGIGLAVAKRLCAEGAHVALADINVKAAKRHAEELTSAGFIALAFPVNLRQLPSIRQLVKATKASLGLVDILINNAAVQLIHDFFSIDDADWDATMEVNLRGPFFLGQAIARELIKTGRQGVIINLASTNSVVARPDMVAYATSKGGVTMLTRGMAVALAPYGIRVLAVAPGTIETPNTAASLRVTSTRKRILSRTPAGRLGRPEDVSSVVAFLASDGAGYMTGTTVFVEGGRLALGHVNALPIIKTAISVGRPPL